MKKTMVVLVMVMMAVGFDWSLSQETNDVVQITIKNQFSCAVSIYVNGTPACYANVNSSCTVPVKIGEGPYKLEARGGPFNNVLASETFDPLAPGENMIWETGNVELNPIPRWCTIAMYNPYKFPVRFYINGEYQGYCLGWEYGKITRREGFDKWLPATVKCDQGPFRLEARNADTGELEDTKTVNNLQPEYGFDWHPNPNINVEPPPDQIKDAVADGAGSPSKGNASAGLDAGDMLLILTGVGVAGGAIWYAVQLANQRGQSNQGGQCQSGYIPCGSTGKCCPESSPWLNLAQTGCYSLYYGMDSSQYIHCHPLTLKLKK